MESQIKDLVGLPSEEQSPATAEKSYLRLRGKCFFLTFPQSSVTKEDALKRIIENKWPQELDWAIVAQEQHASGDLHLHAIVVFKKPLDSKNTNLFDFVCQKHGNYQSCRSLKASVQYVIKYGQYVSYHIDLKEFLSEKKEGKEKIGSSVALMLQEGKSLIQINKEQPGYVLQHKRKIEEYQSWIQKKNYKPAKTWTILSLMTLSGPNYKIAKWLNRNLFQQRPYGAKDLFIHGTTQLGKTSLIIKLQEFCRIYLVPLTEDWYDHYNDEDFDLAVMDEFKGHKTLFFMNEWCQGAPMYLKKRGIAGYTKKVHIPTIIVSNYSLSDCYAKALSEHSMCLEPLKRRLKQVEVIRGLTI